MIAAMAQESILQISAGGSDLATLDPHCANTTTDKTVVGLIFNGLVRFAPGSADPKDLEPDLRSAGKARPIGEYGRSSCAKASGSTAIGAS
jgi:peptide/nickel transport system substrate-binding protein